MQTEVSAKILVPTDFSVNSRVGMRYAIQLARLWDAELVFLHVFHMPREMQESDEEFSALRKRREEDYRARLKGLAEGLYRSMQEAPGKFSCEAIEGIPVDSLIIDYCRHHPEIKLICISTQGAGNFDKVLGTHAGNLVTRSPIPVLAVPKNYRLRPVKSILYASDFEQFEKELEIVTAFAGKLKVPVRVLHFCSPGESLEALKAYTRSRPVDYEYGIKFSLRSCVASHSLVRDLQQQIQRSRPSLVVLFTRQDRSFFQRFFQSSRSEMLAFETRVPLLVFNKKILER